MLVVVSQANFTSLRSTELTIDPGNKLCYSLDTAVDTGLAVDVVVLDSVKKSRQTPKRVGFYSIQRIWRKMSWVE